MITLTAPRERRFVCDGGEQEKDSLPGEPGESLAFVQLEELDAFERRGADGQSLSLDGRRGLRRGRLLRAGLARVAGARDGDALLASGRVGHGHADGAVLAGPSGVGGLVAEIGRAARRAR